MSHIPPHFWLEMQPTGFEAQESRTLRVEDKELLAAVGSRPSRVLDVFRRLRWTESQAFQDALNRMVIRGWIVARETLGEPLDASSTEEQSSGEDPLAALLARYANEAGGHPFDDDPGFAFPGHSSEEDSDTARPVQEEALGAGASEEDQLPAPLDESSNFSEEPQPVLTQDNPEQPGDEEVPGPSPWEKVPPSPPATERDAEDLIAAMGLADGAKRPPSPAPPSSPSEEPAFSSHESLLKALLRGAPMPNARPVVDVPEYGMGPAAPTVVPAPDDFVRLRDVGATVGPGDGPSSSPLQPSPAPDKKRGKSALGATEPVSERTRRRQQDRQRMLEAARREQAQREEAKERAEKMRIQKEVEAEERERRLQHQRAQEEADRGSTFLSRAERARRIRDGLISKPKDD